MIKYLLGDATKPIMYPTIIAHVCNNINKWGKGFVVPLGKKYPEAKYKYHEWFLDSDKFNDKPILGNTQFVVISDTIAVANMIAQEGIYKINGKIPLKYDSLRECLKKVNEFAIKHNAVVNMPRIGCGLAGGEWNKVEHIIKETVFVDTYIFTLSSEISKYEN